MNEPVRLRSWRLPSVSGSCFFTCGRPGRSGGKSAQVPDELVDRWVEGLPRQVDTIISLLGRKNGPNGKSEFSFYSFCGAADHAAERLGRPTFQEWLHRHHPNRMFLVIECPTYDGVAVPPEVIRRVHDDLKHLFAEKRSPVIVDSGGVQRTGFVCRAMGAELLRAA